MAKYKFKINAKKDLSDERIAGHKDFKKLMHNYQHLTNPLYRTPLHKRKNAKVLLVLLIVLLLAYILSEIK